MQNGGKATNLCGARWGRSRLNECRICFDQEPILLPSRSSDSLTPVSAEGEISKIIHFLFPEGKFGKTPIGAQLILLPF